jgi:hypothetical protein
MWSCSMASPCVVPRVEEWGARGTSVVYLTGKSWLPRTSVAGLWRGSDEEKKRCHVLLMTCVSDHELMQAVHINRSVVLGTGAAGINVQLCPQKKSGLVTRTEMPVGLLERR